MPVLVALSWVWFVNRLFKNQEPVFAGHFQNPALRQIHQRRPFANGRILRLRFTKRADDRCAGVVLRLCLAKLVEIVQRT